MMFCIIFTNNTSCVGLKYPNNLKTVANFIDFIIKLKSQLVLQKCALKVCKLRAEI